MRVWRASADPFWQDVEQREQLHLAHHELEVGGQNGGDLTGVSSPRAATFSRIANRSQTPCITPLRPFTTRTLALGRPADFLPGGSLVRGQGVSLDLTCLLCRVGFKNPHQDICSPLFRSWGSVHSSRGKRSSRCERRY